MAKQKQKNAEAAGEEEMEEDDRGEMADLSRAGSGSACGAAGPGGRGGLLPPEGMSLGPVGGHTVACTLTISLAIPARPTGQKQKISNPPDFQGKRIQVDKSGAIPRMQHCYHIEYFLLPDDLVPRKLDFVVFGVVAKLFTESSSKAITPWIENDKMWISWDHSVDIIVTNEYLIKLRDHKTLKIWDTKDKVSSKAKLCKQNIISSLERDAEAVAEETDLNGLAASNCGLPDPSRRDDFCTVSKMFPSSYSVQPCLPPTGRKRSGPKRSIDATAAKEDGIASLQLDVMPLLAGEKLVISCLAENSPEILDAYMTFTVGTPLLSERQRHELNPLTIRITLATCLPNTPVPTEVLQKLCLPTYCTYKFHNFPPHRTHGQLHGTHVCFKDVNVLLTGTMKPGELQRYLQGPPLETEVHDHDRNTENNTKKPSLFGEGAADEKVGKESFLACKSTACNSYTVNKVWHPHGVAKVSLTDLLLGKKCLTISASIHNCSAPRTAAFSEEDEKEKIAESVSHSSLLPMGHYLEPGSLLKVRVETAVPLGMHGEIADAQVANCPYGSIIYIFDYNNPSLLHDLVEEVTEINAKALRLDLYPVHLIGMALAALKLKTTLEKILELDIVTGFHLLDGATHLFVLEGLKDKAIQKLWDKHFERTHRREGGQLEILYNSQLSFHQRLYADRGAIFRHFCLCQPLFTLTKQPLPYVRGELPRACFQALSRLRYLYHSKRLRDVTHGDLLPSAAMITALSRQYGVPLTDEDLFTQKPPLLSFSSDDYTAPGKVSRGNQAVHSSFDNHNEVCAQRKKEIADKMTSERNPAGTEPTRSPSLQARIGAVCQPKGKVEKAKLETFRIVPVDGKSVFNYSAQSLNSAELAKRLLRQEMAKEPDNRFTYCQEYLSATFDPVDVVAACKEFLAKSRSVWLSPDGFVFPGFKGSIESHLHPRMPDEARLEELREKWQENALHANVEPVLARDRWSWDKRCIDFDLYKKLPELFVTTAPQTVHCSPCEAAAPILQTAFDDTELKGLPTRGPRARSQRQKHQGLLKDEPGKFSAGKVGPVPKPVPALSMLDRQWCQASAVPSWEAGRASPVALYLVPMLAQLEAEQGCDPLAQQSASLRNSKAWISSYFAVATHLVTRQTNGQEREDAPPPAPTRETISRTRHSEVVLDTGNRVHRKRSRNSSY